jgi:hypothetical protein
MGYNELEGGIPQELGGLANLQHLSLRYNNLSGDIPWELGNLANLQVLWMHFNQLSGYVPTSLGNLPELQQLYLFNNQLDGPIPSELGELGNLRHVNLSNNQLSGQIPSSFGNLTNLQSLVLDNNQLEGSIPPELGNLIKLTGITLNHNLFEGPIPTELGNLTLLNRLQLQNNVLEGQIPSSFGNFLNLRHLHLSGNNLKGPIPSEMGNLTNLLDDSADFKYNALYTDDESLRDFLNLKQGGGDWETTQTIAPTDVMADSATTETVAISWTPIAFYWLDGGYRVFWSTDSGGPYTLFDTTIDKRASSLVVSGLDPGTNYYFVVQTFTSPHVYNISTVESEYSEEVSATTVSVNDPPVAHAGEDRVVPAGENGLAEVTLDGTSSSDPDQDPLTYTWTGPFGTATGPTPIVSLGLGIHTITLTVDDGNGETASDTVQITVEDQTPPTFQSISVDPGSLWPPNHQMILITPTFTVGDNCDPDPVVELELITMNEGDETNTYDPKFDETIGDGNTTDDIQVDIDGNIYLRAERSGAGYGRIYTLKFKVTDSAGNSSSATVTVTVPHSK